MVTILESYTELDGSTTYTFLKYDPISEAIQTAYREPLNHLESNMNLKFKAILLNGIWFRNRRESVNRTAWENNFYEQFLKMDG